MAARACARGQPLANERAKRADWAEGLAVKPFAEGMEILYFAGLLSQLRPQGKKVARATVEILNKAGVDFGILGPEESCCGESIRKTGDEALFKTLARENIKTFIDHGVKRILVSSPHCYHSFKNEYPEFKVNFEVVHIHAAASSRSLQEGRLKLKTGVPQRRCLSRPRAIWAGTTGSMTSRGKS